MALRAGRVGVAPDQVNQQGKVKGADIAIARPDKAGLVKPVAKTASMTKDVGIDLSGKLFTEPSGEKFYIDVFPFEPSSNPSQSKTAGFKFKTMVGGLTVDGIRVFPRATEAKVYISTDDTHHVLEKSLTGLTSGEWNTIMLDTPIKLNANTLYVLWYTGTGDDSILKYKSGLISSMFVTNVSTVTASTIDTFPTSAESNSYGVDIITHLLS